MHAAMMQIPNQGFKTNNRKVQNLKKRLQRVLKGRYIPYGQFYALSIGWEYSELCRLLDILDIIASDTTRDEFLVLNQFIQSKFDPNCTIEDYYVICVYEGIDMQTGWPRQLCGFI